MNAKKITLADLAGVLDHGVDVYDNEIDASFYLEPEEVSERLAGLLEVVQIGRDHITCRVTDLLRQKRTAVKRYLRSNYYEGAQLDWLLETLTTGDDITRDGGDAVWHFIEYDAYDFLTH